MSSRTVPFLRLGVNIDHVATVRNARGGAHPDPVRAAHQAVAAGADGITAHLREDRRHIRDADIVRLKSELTVPLNFEMAVTDEMVAIALQTLPNAACLVPERREEVTTEGGLDVAGDAASGRIRDASRRLADQGIRVSHFIDPDPAQIAAAAEAGAQIVELHTGPYCEACLAGDAGVNARELERLRTSAHLSAHHGLEVHAGHGLTYNSVGPVAAMLEMHELNIGHFLMGEAMLVGLPAAIQRMRRHMNEAREAAAEVTQQGARTA